MTYVISMIVGAIRYTCLAVMTEAEVLTDLGALEELWRERLDPGLGSVLKHGVRMGPACWPLLCLVLRLRETIKAYRQPAAGRLSARARTEKPHRHTMNTAILSGGVFGRIRNRESSCSRKRNTGGDRQGL